MSHTLTLSAETLMQLDLSPAKTVIESLLKSESVLDPDATLRFEIEFPREPADPREFSEIPEIRLWFVRLDAEYPWLPLVLDWESGELGRYAAMVVPHQFSPKDGIRYNPEALEIFVMSKIFVISKWLQSRGISTFARLKFMTQMLGYEIEDGLFELLTSEQ